MAIYTECLGPRNIERRYIKSLMDIKIHSVSNIIQYHPTSFNMVAEHVQSVEFNNVEKCWMEMLDPFVRGLKTRTLKLLLHENKAYFHEHKLLRL